MLRINVDQHFGVVTLKLQGKVSGPWVRELDRSWSDAARNNSAGAITLDLTDVTFVNSEGQELLRSLFRKGTDLRSGSLMTRFLINRIKESSNGTHHERDNGG